MNTYASLTSTVEKLKTGLKDGFKDGEVTYDKHFPHYFSVETCDGRLLYVNTAALESFCFLAYYGGKVIFGVPTNPVIEGAQTDCAIEYNQVWKKYSKSSAFLYYKELLTTQQAFNVTQPGGDQHQKLSDMLKDHNRTSKEKATMELSDRMAWVPLESVFAVFILAPVDNTPLLDTYTVYQNMAICEKRKNIPYVSPDGPV
jgi:hypothetical protein